MKNEYLNKLLETIKERNKVVEPGTMQENQDLSDIDFNEVYTKWKSLSEEEMLEYGKELYVTAEEFRQLLNADTETNKRLANYRGITVKGLND